MSTASKMFSGPPCNEGNCKARRFFEEDGYTFCKRGHQQEGQRTQQDDHGLGTQGRKTRIKKGSQEKVSQISRNHLAASLYLQSYQLILWKQCYALIHTIGLPSELETVVKDLWATRLQLLRDRIDATSGDDTVFSSQPQSEVEKEVDSQGEDGLVTRQWKVKMKAMPTLIQTLALCYLGCALLKLPVSMGDMHRWAVREDIPFIRAIRFVPPVMKQKLPAEYLKALDTTSPLEPDDLRSAIHNLSLFYAHHFKLEVPKINASLLLYKHMRDLALPITLHPAVMSIADILKLTFSWPLPSQRQQTCALPELTLVSLLVIATKLYYPFHTHKHAQSARSFTDPGALALDWSVWTEAQKSSLAHVNGDSNLPRGSEIKVTEADVMDMTGDQLDQYMDFYERTFVDEFRADTKPRGLPKQLLDMFPTGRPHGSPTLHYSYVEQAEKERLATDEALKTVIGSLRARLIADDGTKEEDIIGSNYRRYRSVEDMEDAAKAFHIKVAEVLGIQVQTLIIAVNQLERKLMVWREAEVKRERDGGGNDGVDQEM